jgi:hypothetical protein
MAWFLQFRIKACVGLTPLYADGRPPSHQAPRGLVPEDMITSGFDSA